MSDNNIEIMNEEVQSTELNASETVNAQETDFSGNVVEAIEIDKEFAEEQARKKRIHNIIDKITTGLFILLLSSPLLVILYIIIWFISVS